MKFIKTSEIIFFKLVINYLEQINKFIMYNFVKELKCMLIVEGRYYEVISVLYDVNFELYYKWIK